MSRRLKGSFPRLTNALRKAGMSEKPFCPKCHVELDPKHIEAHLAACTAAAPLIGGRELRIGELSQPRIRMVPDRADPYRTDPE